MKYLFFLMLFTSMLFSQSYTLSGTVSDSLSQINLPAVNVVVFSAKTNKIINGTVTDFNGKYLLSKIYDSLVVIKYSIIGYSKKNISYSLCRNKVCDLGVVNLAPEVVILKGVDIVETRNFIEYQIDKQVINVNKLPGSAVTAIEVLRNTGAAEVDPMTKKISIHGNEVTIHIDGRAVQSAASIISQMPSEYVDKIEVYSIPSAKEDAKGTGGIINIITKKIEDDSFNGSLSIYKTNQYDFTPTIIINYKKSMFNLFSFVTGTIREKDTFYDRFKINYSNPTEHEFFSSSVTNNNGNNMIGKLGLDIQPDTINTFSVTGEFTRTKDIQNGKRNNVYYNICGQAENSYSQKIYRSPYYLNIAAGLFYKHLFNQCGNELTADVYYSNYTDREYTEDVYNSEMYMKSPALLNSALDNRGISLVAKTDIIYNPDAAGKFEAGLKYSHKSRLNKYTAFSYYYRKDFGYDSLNSNNSFRYYEDIPAAYFTFSKKISKWEFKAGLRAEYSFLSGISANRIDNFDNAYFNLFPSLAVSYKISDVYCITFNSSRRIERPDLEYVNPFTIIKTPSEISKGNPFLRPAFSNLFELNVYPFINLFYSLTNDGISSYIGNVDDSITCTTKINGISSISLGSDFTFPLSNSKSSLIKLPQWLRQIYFRFSYMYSSEQISYLSDNFTASGNYWKIILNLNYKMWFGINGSANIMYIPKIITERRVNYSKTFMGISFWKNYFNDRLQVKLNFNDIFDEMSKVQNEVNGPDFWLYNKSGNKMQSVGLYIRYNINNFEYRDEKEMDDGRDAGEKVL